jgi:hypothetical protein
LEDLSTELDFVRTGLAEASGQNERLSNQLAEAANLIKVRMIRNDNFPFV